MQMTKFEYLMELIANNVETYNRNSRYKDKFSLTFANGDNIKIYVPNSSVPHLLGINTNYLMSSGLYREKWDRQLGDSTYGAITIDNAIRSTTKTYKSSHYEYE